MKNATAVEMPTLAKTGGATKQPANVLTVYTTLLATTATYVNLVSTEMRRIKHVDVSRLQ